MAKKKLISICLTTYDRPKLLEEGIKKWVREIEGSHLQDTVELVIGNDGSVEETREILSKYSHKYSYVRHFNNIRNLGFPGNITKLLFTAKGDYVWTLSDDDFIYKDCLLEVVKILREHNPEQVYLNYDAKVLDTGKIISNMLNIRKNYFFKNRRDFFRFFRSVDSIFRVRSAYLSFISFYLTKRELLVRNYNQVKEVVNLEKQHFPHSWILWFNFPEKNIFLYHKPIFLQYFSISGHTAHSYGWFDTCLKFKRGLNPLYGYIIKKYGKEGGVLFAASLYGGRLYSYLTIFISFIFLIKDKIKILIGFGDKN